jgi:hypothetical protein
MQKITVEHVHVHSGGQAVVGIVETPGGGVQPKPESQASRATRAAAVTWAEWNVRWPLSA